MAKIISFANQKGGVGKTTTAINVSAAMGRLGKKVLLVDMDPQGNATAGLGITKNKLTVSVYDALIEKTDAKNVIHKTKFTNLSIMPSNILLAGAELDLSQMENQALCAKKMLAPVLDDYDYIFIDCPPALGLLTVNALAASDGIIIPMQCEYYALEGLSQLMLTVRKVRQLYNPALDITGILLTMYNKQLLLTKQVKAEINKYYEEKLFKNEISRSVKLSEAPSFGKPICYYSRYNKGALEYQAVAKEILLRI